MLYVLFRLKNISNTGFNNGNQTDADVQRLTGINSELLCKVKKNTKFSRGYQQDFQKYGMMVNVMVKQLVVPATLCQTSSYST